MSLLQKVKRIFCPPTTAELNREIAGLKIKLVQLGQERDAFRAAVMYGNTVPLWANRDGIENWNAARETYRGAIDPVIHEEFVKIGHIVRPEGLFPTDLIQRLSAAFNAAVEDPQKANNPFLQSEKLLKAYCDGPLPGPVPDCRRDLLDAERDLPMWQEIFSPDFVALLRSCYGSNFSVCSVHAARNSHCPPEFLKVFEPFSDRWHFDDQHTDTVYIFIYLRPVGMEHGPFHVHNIENSRRLLQLGYDKSKRRQSIGCGLDPEIYENPPSTKLTGPAGACIITMNSLCMHRAGTPDAAQFRDLLYIKLRPAKELNLVPGADQKSMTAL
jgi:hypothetical protein